MNTDLSVADGFFRCPKTQQSLSALTPQELYALQNEISAGRRVHADGSKVRETQLSFCLGTSDREVVYSVEDGIFCMLPELAILREGHSDLDGSDERKRVVQKFYDDFGWVKGSDGSYGDSIEFISTQKVALDYQARCDARVTAQLRGGRFLLDAASGAIPHPSYLAFSSQYEKRICLDFSVRALREARTKLPDGHGIYVLGDLTRLPFADNVIDDVVSLHTIYHVPADQQTTAVDELVRVLKPHGRAVIVYTWNKSPLMAGAAQLTMLAGRLRQILLRRPPPQIMGRSAAPALYFHPHGREWFRVLQVRHKANLKVWSTTGTQFNKALFKDTVAGRAAANLVFWVEGLLEPVAARFGQYPMFIINKRPK